MDSKIENQFVPNYAIPPGETLLETIEALGMSQAELAARTGRPKKTINEIVKGKVAITPETALQLEHVLSIPASFWNNLERNYRESLARLEEQERLQKQVDWLGKIPLKVMIKASWIQSFDDKIKQLQEVLKFFGVASSDQWHKVWQAAPAEFRRSPAFRSDLGAVACWLRKGEIQAQQIECAPYDADTFRRALRQIRILTVQPLVVFQPEMVHLCADAGVAVVFVPDLPKLRVCGATRWLTPNKALIQLSLRYKTDDHLWFSFFHEAGHILLHGKRDVFLDVDGDNNSKEQEANQFAANELIPAVKFEKFKKAGLRSKAAIKQFADEIGIAPGIIVGRLQHEGVLPRSYCNDLKRRFYLPSQQRG